MQINSKEVLFGQPILKIREVVRKSMNERLFGSSQNEIEDKVSQILRQPIIVAREVIKQLIENDYLLLNKEKFQGIDNYSLIETNKGRRFGIAKATSPISREKATKILNDLIERAKAINTNDEFLYYVESIKVFGSYLSDKELLGDLDVGVKLSQKYLMGKYRSIHQKKIKLVKKEGKRFNSFLDELFWPYREVMLKLKSRQIGLSLHDEEDDEVFKVTETKQVFEYKENMLNHNNKTN